MGGISLAFKSRGVGSDRGYWGASFGLGGVESKPAPSKS
jgi:hypothetical protein